MGPIHSLGRCKWDRTHEASGGRRERVHRSEGSDHGFDSATASLPESAPSGRAALVFWASRDQCGGAFVGRTVCRNGIAGVDQLGSSSDRVDVPSGGALAIRSRLGRESALGGQFF